MFSRTLRRKVTFGTLTGRPQEASPTISAILSFFREFPVAEAVRIMRMRSSHAVTCVGLSAIAAVLDGLMLLTLIPISQGAAQHDFNFVWKWPVLRFIRPHTPPALHNYTGTFWRWRSLPLCSA